MSNPTSQSVKETCDAINAACKGAAAGYSCKSVSWDDVSRGTVGGGVSCWGSNITDTRLWSKSGKLLYTVRSDNWNEKLGKVSADSVAIVVGNHKPSETVGLEAITLRDFLINTGQYAGYAGINTDTNLFDEQLDKEISIRFQTTFLPVPADDELAKMEFCTEAYNYNTRSDDNPRNAVLLCTSQGIAFQQDGAGAKKLFHHAVNPADGTTVHRYWLEAERSRHKVGGAQKETQQEAVDAAKRGKATASVIGIEAMGTRFNVLMTIQIPVKQQPPPPPPAPPAGTRGDGLFGKKSPKWCSCVAVRDNGDGTMKVKWHDGTVTSRLPTQNFSYGWEEEEEEECCAMEMFGDDDDYYDDEDDDDWDYVGGGGGGSVSNNKGISNAARVSRGSEVDTWSGVAHKHPQRDPSQHITITVVMYNTVAGGVPSPEDVQAAIQDMEQLYEACSWRGDLADEGANFMKSELTVADCMDIDKKVTEQPYAAPQCGLVKNATVFPPSA